jgi:hypothetical protein
LNANGLILILFGEKRDDVMLDVRLGVEDHDELKKIILLHFFLNIR